jgi:hypothetical protein
MPAGRPPKYKTPEEMQVDIDNYLDNTYIIDQSGNKIYRPTVEGLAYALNMSRKSLIRYSEKDEFSHTIKRAKQRVAMALEEHLWGNNVTGAIFNLKNNFGWKDKQEVEQSGQISVINLHSKFKKSTDE